MLTVYNSITRQKEEFKPLIPKEVKLYVCGMTVYDYCHIGHARVLVNFDFITRYFRFLGYDVTYVRNITDIDDKIIKRALENQEPVAALTERYIQAMHQDCQLLGVLPVTEEPRATQYIAEMITMIETLLKKEYAYVGDNGDVYYNVAAFEKYGELANKDLDSLQSGIRVAITEAKHNPLDFVLWKMAKPDEPSWPSPWGDGRPGWHIECSAMSTQTLAAHFDIHGGGFDLKFPHHENEIAQSEAATGEKFVNYWLHVGFVQVNKEKMSKSLGNFFTIRDVLANYDPEVVRYFLMASHYRSPINYGPDALDMARQALERFYSALRGLPVADRPLKSDFEQRFINAMNDDFNTPIAFSVLFDLVHEINVLRQSDEQSAAALGALLRYLGQVLGLLQRDPEEWFKALSQVSDKMIDDIEAWIAKRIEARTHRDWAEADRIRQLLLEKGVVLEDSDQGTTWKKR